ncbi:MAG: hypothetical protein Q8M18_18025 [Bradyrhizobium sp.]|nr:hypothetical protein [Bradyrhizobium sp.]
MMKGLFALVLASALVPSQTAMASESEFRNDGAARTAASFSGNLPLPPIPYLDSMPWIGLGADSRSPGIGSLLMPDFDAPAILKNSAFATNNVGNAETQSSEITK